MAESPYPIGRRFAPFSFVVEQAKVDELCLALRDDDPAYRRGAAPTPIPPTFLNTSIQTLVTGRNPVDELGISRRHALHAGQSYEYLAQIHVGDQLTGQTTLTEVIEKQGRAGTVHYLTLQTSFEREGVPVAIVCNRVAVRAAATGSAAA